MREIKVMVVPDNEYKPIRFETVTPDLQTFTGLLGGGYLEGVQVPGENWLAYVDEEGKLKNLPVNTRASRLAYRLGWSVGDYLCGPVVFAGTGPYPDPEEHDVPDTVIEMARWMGLIPNE